MPETVGGVRFLGYFNSFHPSLGPSQFAGLSMFGSGLWAEAGHESVQEFESDWSLRCFDKVVNVSLDRKTVRAEMRSESFCVWFLKSEYNLQ